MQAGHIFVITGVIIMFILFFWIIYEVNKG